MSGSKEKVTEPCALIVRINELSRPMVIVLCAAKGTETNRGLLLTIVAQDTTEGIRSLCVRKENQAETWPETNDGMVSRKEEEEEEERGPARKGDDEGLLLPPPEV